MSVYINAMLEIIFLRIILDIGNRCSTILDSTLKADAVIYPQFKKTMAGISGNTVESRCLLADVFEEST